MGLDVPDLDDRDFEEILEDAIKRIPVHAEEWTDHNAHDPGVTILELLAWLSETYGYQLDRIDDRHRRKYLSLAGVEPRGPRPATARVKLSVPSDLDGAVIPAGEPLVAETPGGDRVWFRAEERVVVTDANVVAVVSEVAGERRLHDTANDRRGMHYRAFGDDPSAGDALYLGFDADPFAASDRLDLWVDFHEADLPAPATHGEEAIDFEPSHGLLWERPTDPDRIHRPSTWERLRVVDDGTNGFYGSGRVSLRTPTARAAEPARAVGHERPLYWIRCRLARREPTATDRHRDSKRAEPPEPHYEVPPQFDAVVVNVLKVCHRRTVFEEPTGEDGSSETTARPNQRFRLEPPVLSASVTVDDEEWTERPDFAASGPDDRHYTLDKQTGTITFGDGRRGTLPRPGQSVTATYDRGGGTAGNVSPESSWTFRAGEFSRIDVRSHDRASGGRNSETTADALARARARRDVPHRAVTAADYRYLATHTPGLRFGRAAVVDGGGDGVCVVVVPYAPPPGRAVPSRGFLAAVERHLERHSLLSDRVSVVAPTYVGVDVTASVSPAEEATERAARNGATDALEVFFTPLGDDGWPFGRPIHRSEVYAILEGVDAVDDVLELTLESDAPLAGDPTALPYPNSIVVTVREAGDRCGRGI